MEKFGVFCRSVLDLNLNTGLRRAHYCRHLFVDFYTVSNFCRGQLHNIQTVVQGLLDGVNNAKLSQNVKILVNVG